MTWSKRREMFFKSNRPHSRTSATMGNAEGFVEVHVQNIRTDFSGLGYADQGIQICTIHIHLSTMMMDDVANLGQRFFKNTVGGRISNHQS